RACGDMTDPVPQMLFAAEEAHSLLPTFHPAIAAAQAVLESGLPPSQLAMKYGNCLGIKAGKSWKGASVNLETGEETASGEPYDTVAAFRVYRSWQECFLDYAKIMELPWYSDAREGRGDPIRFLLGLITPNEP